MYQAITEQPSLDLPYPDGWLESQGLIFTDEDIAIIREGILIDALQSAVDGRCANEVREEMREWIENDSIEPFSFSVCATARGADPIELRSVYQRLFYRDRPKNTWDETTETIREQV